MIVVKAHSFVDVITNSSTELFVCDSQKTLETVNAILEEKWEHFIKLYPNQYEFNDHVTPNRLSVWDVLNTHVATKEEIDRERRDDYAWDYWEETEPGDILISGNDDNSIPYEFFDVIEAIFKKKCQRHHLG